jgi:hypothetical protein
LFTNKFSESLRKRLTLVTAGPRGLSLSQK